ncbi:ABC transporter substrate-binding protein [Paraliomyxa miuraensis]|nr:ABC transporter substrate-binding protein [Paraliomyxa miuraensis]
MSDDELVLGTHTSLSGPLAAYGQVAVAAQAVFHEVNAHGGVHGRRIRLELRDDRYEPERAQQAVRTLVHEVGVLAIVLGSGTPTHATVADELQALGVPDLWVISGSRQIGEPRRTTLFPGNVSYARMAACLVQHLRAWPVSRVAVLVQRSAVGDELLEGLRAAYGGTPAWLELRHELSGSLHADVERAMAAGTRALLCMATPSQVADAITHAHGLHGGLGPRPRWSTVFTDGLVDALGPDAEGLVSCHWLRLPEGHDDPAIREHAALIQRRAPQVAVTGTSVGGQVLAEATVEVLRRAGPHPTREGVIAAAESMAGWRSPLALVPAACTPDEHALFAEASLLEVRRGRWVCPTPPPRER